MSSSTARTALVGVLSVVIAVLLFSLGFLVRFAFEDDAVVVQQPVPAEVTPTVEASVADDAIDIDSGLLEEIIGNPRRGLRRARSH